MAASRKSKKNWNNLLLLAGLAIATIASYFLVTDKKGISQTTSPGANNPPPPKQCLAEGSEFPMELGSGYATSANATCERVYVTTIQGIINKFLIKPSYGLDLLTVDGLFGVKTEAAVYRLWGVKYVNKILYDNMLNYKF